MPKLERFSIGTGDRFGLEGAAQLAAFAKAKAAGVSASIVWNKSNREHNLIGTEPADQRAAAERAVAAMNWKGSYFVDADHIGLKTVDRFAHHCDFFTLDVADFIGEKAAPAAVDAFVAKRGSLVGSPGLPAKLDADSFRKAAGTYLIAVAEAAKIYRRIRELRGSADFAVEVSMDETADPQSPAELLVILAALAEEKVPVNTIAPKFSGRFNKGVDYVGDVKAFLAEFEADVKVALWAPKALGLPEGLKLSVHSGSDKFSLYPGIGEIVRRLGAGLHLKTAGTTWLEEIVGLAEAGGAGLAMAKEIYRAAYGRYDELVAPYLAVVDIDRAKLPKPEAVDTWDSAAFVGALRHVQSDKRFDPGFRQLVHVSFKVAGEMGRRYLDAISAHKDSVSRNVTQNLWERHMKPLFVDR